MFWDISDKCVSLYIEKFTTTKTSNLKIQVISGTFVSLENKPGICIYTLRTDSKVIYQNLFSPSYFSPDLIHCMAL